MPRRLPPRSAKRVARASPPTAYIPKPPQPKTILQRPKLFEGPQKTEPSHLQNLYSRFQTNLDNGAPHFRMGEKEVYFPHAKVVLLRPNPKHTPYQAKFLVPKYFNKLDLRDYLYNIYGLRALKITTQLLWARWRKQSYGAPRYRDSQLKKMTIDMEEPFVWPEPTPEHELEEQLRVSFQHELTKYADDTNRIGSDKLRPPTSFGGLVGPYVEPPQPFIPKRIKRQMLNKKNEAQISQVKEMKANTIKRFLGMV